MKRKALIITVISMLLPMMCLLLGCSEKIERCTYDAYRFPRSIWQTFFPYQTGQNLTFVNEENDTLGAIVTYAQELPYNDEYYTFEEPCGLSNPINPKASFYPVTIEMENGITIEMRAEDVKSGVSRFTIHTKDSDTYWMMRGLDYIYAYYGYSGTEDQLETQIHKFELAIGDTIKYELVGMDDIVKDICHIKNEGLFSFYDVKNQCRWQVLR